MSENNQKISSEELFETCSQLVALVSDLAETAAQQQEQIALLIAELRALRGGAWN